MLPEALKRLLRPVRVAIETRTVLAYAAARGWRPSSLRTVRTEDLRWNFGYENEDQIKNAIRLILPYTLTSFDRLATLWSQVRYLDDTGVPGALVECGVWKGGSSGMMALAHMATASPPLREIHLFDAFRGMPEPKEIDGPRASASMFEPDSYPETISRDLMIRQIGYPKELVTFHVGWFHETLPADAHSLGSIALLRLDGDWYESTKICLVNLYDQVSPGGLVVIDDYGHFEGCRVAVDEFLKGYPGTMLHRVDYTARYWIKDR
jgi:O-methyltransferase